MYGISLMTVLFYVGLLIIRLVIFIFGNNEKNNQFLKHLNKSPFF